MKLIIFKFKREGLNKEDLEEMRSDLARQINNGLVTVDDSATIIVVKDNDEVEVLE